MSQGRVFSMASNSSTTALCAPVVVEEGCRSDLIQHVRTEVLPEKALLVLLLVLAEVLG